MIGRPTENSAARVVVPCEPTFMQVIAGAKQLGAWGDDALAQEVDGAEMARRVYKAMTSAADDAGPEFDL